jgi:ABC-type uncharacterized transport system substrate-binding protein
MDVQVAARALSFMERPVNGPLRVGILYAPNSAQSTQQARELQQMLGSGLRAGKIELRPQLVRVGEASSAGVDLFFLTEFVGSDAALEAAKATKLPCVTTDMAQVESGACVMGVRSQPKVQIVVNRAAAERADVRFATIFRVMITEL